MEHVVFYPASDGSPAFRRLASLEDAVQLVEHLRNVEGVASVSLHALTEVPLAFRAYYKVEVPTTPAAAPPVEPPVVSEVVVEQVAARSEEPVAASNGHGATPTSLGFFA